MSQFDTLYFQKYLGEDEELLFVCHRHAILVIDNILLWCFFGGILPIFFYLQNTFGITGLVPVAWFELYLVGIYVAIIFQVFDWYNDVWIITNKGIIDVTWDIVTGSKAYLGYEAVKGIEVKSNSFMDAIFDKGDIWVYLESEHNEFYLPDAASPQSIVEYIHAVIDEMHSHEEEGEVDDRKPFELLLDTLTEMVREHLENKWGNTEDTELQKRKLEEALRYTSTVDLRGVDS